MCDGFPMQPRIVMPPAGLRSARPEDKPFCREPMRLPDTNRAGCGMWMEHIWP